MEFYCEPCETAMCRECTEGERREHRDHRTVPLRDVLEQHKAALQHQLDAVRARLPQLAAAVGLVAEISRQLGQRRAEAEAEIGSSFEELEAALRQRREVLLRDLEATCAAKQQVTHLGLCALHQPFLGACPDGAAAEAEVQDNRNGTYELVYTPRSEGDFVLSILLYGQPVRGSPFRARALRPSDVPPSPEEAKRRVKSPGGGHVRQKALRRPASMYGSAKRKENPIEDELIFRVGSRGREKGEVTNLQGISTSSAGRIVVADSNNQCVQVFSNEGQFRLRFGVRGRSPGQLQSPTGVSVDTNGDIIVADYDNRWVSVFSPEGKFKTKLGAGRLMGPKGVAVDKNGHIIVVDNKACCVFIFQPNGKLVARFGSRGTAERQFAGPHFVAVNNKNEIVVTDFHNHSVKVYNAEGEFLFKFGSHGEGNGQFNAPTGVAVDSNGNIIVADWGNSRIQVFDSAGSFLSYINTAADPLYGPQGLALTSDGHVVVADS
ncbi:tripartite motif-containing protein 2-like, partial [Geospiza fortis]|uniref:RING-type E3 ubiquitin transferase n=1 Tax=Geospiza fortis TaxID=48883 RepID=A0A8N5F5Y0_GEOFO